MPGDSPVTTSDHFSVSVFRFNFAHGELSIVPVAYDCVMINFSPNSRCVPSVIHTQSLTPRARVKRVA